MTSVSADERGAEEYSPTERWIITIVAMSGMFCMFISAAWATHTTSSIVVNAVPRYLTDLAVCDRQLDDAVQRALVQIQEGNIKTRGTHAPPANCVMAAALPAWLSLPSCQLPQPKCRGLYVEKQIYYYSFLLI